MAEITPFLLGGTDGVRGVATFGPDVEGEINPDMVAGLTYALVQEQIENGGDGSIVIGHDTRPSSRPLEVAAVAGAVAAGSLEVTRLGVAPTPMTLKIADDLCASAAVSITASHNPYADNGWKGTFGSDKPVGDQVTAISDRYWSQRRSGLHIPYDTGGYEENPALRRAYINMVVEDIREQSGAEKPLEGKLFVIDSANGAAMEVTPEVFEELGAEVVTYACDGSSNINEGCGATDLEGVKAFLRAHPELVQRENFVGVLAHDGDADRVIGLGATIENGEMVFAELEGNRFMELYASNQPGIVGTDYTNDAMVRRLTEKGIGFEYCRNGDVNVTKALRDRQANGDRWTRGGEFTGHHVDLPWLSSGDGIRMAAMVAALAANNGTTFAEMAGSMPLWPQAQLKIKLGALSGEQVMQHPDVIAVIEEAEQYLSDGRVLVRPSGTEPVVRAWAVGEEEVAVGLAVRAIGDRIKEVVAA